MRRRSSSGASGEELRRRIMGLGEQSLRKSYYPELRRRLDELERFRTLLDQTSDAIFLIEVPRGVLADVSEAACRMLGQPREALVGRPASAAVPSICACACAPGAGGRQSTTLHAADGREIPVEVQVSAVEFERSRYAVAVARDITERRQAEEALGFLSRAGARLGASLDLDETVASILALATEHLGDLAAVYLRRPDGSVVRSGLRSRRPELEPIARELQRRFPAPEGEELGVRACLTSGEPQRLEPCASCAGGPERHALWDALGARRAYAFPLLWRGSVRGALLLGCGADPRCGSPVQERLAAEFASRSSTALQNAQLFQDAREANRTKDEFLAVVSHELRTPLTSILGWARLLEGTPPRTDPGRALASIQRNARSLAQIIDDLLDVSRIAAGKVQLELAPLDLAAVVQSAAETLRPLALARGLCLEVSAPPLPPFRGDAKRLEQVVWNLVSNAVKFTPAGGRVEVRLERTPEGPRLAVQDTGRGIDPAFLPYVFEPFRQADSSTTRKFGGLGLGLAIVQRLVRLHRGCVRVHSAGEGQGTLFTVALPPEWAAPLPRPPSPPAAREPGELSGVRVLVVDDDRDTRELVRELLRESGAEVALAGSTREALGAIERCRAQVLLSDLAMPGEDGFALARALRGRGLALPAAALTAMVRPEDARRALAAGFDRFVTKPVDPEALVAVVAELASRRSAAVEAPR